MKSKFKLTGYGSHITGEILCHRVIVYEFVTCHRWDIVQVEWSKHLSILCRTDTTHSQQGLVIAAVYSMNYTVFQKVYSPW